ncbi:DUF6082 family protein [Streptomyces sp. NPDC001642]|uniref:DUF6082 family protein n=1 Tax=Streptomyces sp. NPDC001642 TaxID=3154392 RepID=UPI00331C87E6
MTERQPAEQVIERMVGAAFPAASYGVVREAAVAIADVGMRRGATTEDTLAFANRFQSRLNPSSEPAQSDPSDARSTPAQPSKRPGRRSRARRSLWPATRRRETAEEERTQWESSEAERRKMVLAASQQHLSLLRQAMDDPGLAEVVANYNLPPDLADRRRRYLACEMLYEQTVLAYRIGAVDRRELYGRMRALLQSPYFREWWDASTPYRQSVSTGNEEIASVDHMVDGLVRDLDDTDTDEWWVVGNMPDGPGDIWS